MEDIEFELCDCGEVIAKGERTCTNCGLILDDVIYDEAEYELRERLENGTATPDEIANELQRQVALTIQH